MLCRMPEIECSMLDVSIKDATQEHLAVGFCSVHLTLSTMLSVSISMANPKHQISIYNRLQHAKVQGFSRGFPNTQMSTNPKRTVAIPQHKNI